MCREKKPGCSDNNQAFMIALYLSRQSFKSRDKGMPEFSAPPKALNDRTDSINFEPSLAVS